MARKRRERSLDDVARAEGVDAAELLREVAEFRVALDAELTVAAAAVEAGHPDIAAESFEGARTELDAWSTGVRAGLDHPLRRESDRRRRSLVNRTTVSTAVAAGLVGLFAGLALPTLTQSPTTPATLQETANQTLLDQANMHFDRLAEAAHGGDPTAVAQAARTLQGSVSQLVDAAAHGDTAAGQRAAQILLSEQALISSVPASEQASIIREQQQLTTTLVAALKTTLPLLASGHPSTPIAAVATRPLAILSPTPLIIIAAPSTGAAPIKPSTAPPSTAPRSSPAPTSPSPSPTRSPSPSGSPASSPLIPGTGLGNDGTGLGLHG